MGCLFRRWLMPGICALLLAAVAWIPMGFVLAEGDPGNRTVDEFFQDQGKDASAPANGDESQNRPPDPGPSAGLGGLVLKTVLVLGLIFLLIYGLSRFLSPWLLHVSSKSPMQVRAAIDLGHNKSLKLVKVGNRYFLLGVGENIQLIREFSSPEESEELDRLLDVQSSGGRPDASFALHKIPRRFWELLRGRTDADGQTKGFEAHLEERIQQIRQTRIDFLKEEEENSSGEGKGDPPA